MTETTIRCHVTLFLLALLLVLCSGHELRFRKDGTFKIMQMTDLHFEDNEEVDSETSEVMGFLLDAERPDVVVITGDAVSGFSWNGQSGWFEKLWKKWTQPMKQRGVPWALALGNHDAEADLSGKEIVELEMTSEWSLTRPGPSEIPGSTNFFLPVLSSNSSSVETLLYLFDSGNRGCASVPGWGCVEREQVEWYKNVSRAFASSANGPVPSLTFLHIPIPEYLAMWNEQPCYGVQEDEGVCCSSSNSGLFSAIKEMGDVRGVFSGHDHTNDFYSIYDGVMLAYGRKTGLALYGPDIVGARMIEITEGDFSIKTWIRQRDGLIANQTLHEPNEGVPFRLSECCEKKTLLRRAMALSFCVIGVALAAVCLFVTRRSKRGSVEYRQLPQELTAIDSQ